MADIKHYLKEREKRERNQINYKEKIIKHRRTTFLGIALLVIVVLAIALLMYVQYKRHIYTGYDIVSSVAREKAAEATDIRIDDSVLTYSKDGVHCTDGKGNVTWNQTYGIQDIKIDICRDVVAIGSYNGRNIYLGNTEKQLGEITTTMPIRDLTVSATGNVTAVLTDADVTWVNTYNLAGENTYSAKTHMSNSGYPATVSLSPNGELLAVGYVYVDAGVVKTNVAFYNLGPVGANQTDHMVSTFIYHDMLVPMIQFMNDETAFAVGDNRLMFYKGAKKPVVGGEHILNQEIQSVFYDENYVGLVFLSDDAKAKYKLDVYNTKAEKVGSYYFDLEYNDIFFEKDRFTVYNETQCLITTFDGVEKYNGNFSKTVDLMLAAGGAYKYLLVTEQSIDTIQLK